MRDDTQEQESDGSDHGKHRQHQDLRDKVLRVVCSVHQDRKHTNGEVDYINVNSRIDILRLQDEFHWPNLGDENEGIDQGIEQSNEEERCLEVLCVVCTTTHGYSFISKHKIRVVCFNILVEAISDVDVSDVVYQ